MWTTPAATAVVDRLLPPRCALCNTLGAGICRTCAEGLEDPWPGPPPSGVDALVSMCAYAGTGRDLVLALKRGNRRDAARPTGEALAEGAAALLGAEPGVVTWAPTTGYRLRRRGHDQAEVLARSFGRAARRPVARLLHRTSGAQTGLGLADRLGSVAFVAPFVPTATVVVVDDVVTSGATMSAAAAALRAAGAQRVIGVTLARAHRTR